MKKGLIEDFEPTEEEIKEVTVRDLHDAMYDALVDRAIEFAPSISREYPFSGQELRKFREKALKDLQEVHVRSLFAMLIKYAHEYIEKLDFVAMADMEDKFDAIDEACDTILNKLTHDKRDEYRSFVDSYCIGFFREDPTKG